LLGETWLIEGRDAKGSNSEEHHSFLAEGSSEWPAAVKGAFGGPLDGEGIAGCSYWGRTPAVARAIAATSTRKYYFFCWMLGLSNVGLAVPSFGVTLTQEQWRNSVFFDDDRDGAIKQSNGNHQMVLILYP
jgi:hypothetical protein